MKLNEAVSFKRNRYRSVGMMAASLVSLLGLGVYGVVAMINGVMRHSLIDDLGPAPLVAAGLAPIAVLLRYADSSENREAHHVYFLANKLKNVVEERDVLLEALEHSVDKEEFIKRNHRKIISLTKKQQKHAERLERYLSSRDARSFIRDMLPGWQINEIYESIEKAKQGTLHGLVFDSRMNESFSFIKLTTPKVALTRIIHWSLAGALTASTYSVAAFRDFSSPEILASLTALVAAMSTVNRVGQVQHRELGRLVRELEMVVDQRDSMFKEFIGLSSDDRESWIQRNSREIASLTRRQSSIASKLEDLMADRKSANFIENLPERIVSPMEAAIKAAKKGTISSVLSDGRLTESSVIGDRMVKVANLEKWRGRNNILFITGYPGDGKSTLAREIAEKTGAVRINGDRVYRELLDEFNPNLVYEDRQKAWEKMASDIIRRHSGGRRAIMEGVMVGTFATALMDENSPIITFDSNFATSLSRAAKRDEGAIIGSWVGYIGSTIGVKRGMRKWVNEHSISFDSMSVTEILEKVK